VLLLKEARLRRRTAAGLVVSVVAIAAWYAPHASDLLQRSRQQYGVEIGFPWVVTAPIDQIVLPAFLWIDGVVLDAGIVWLPLVALVALLMAPSPLLRERWSAFVLCVGPASTVVVLWLTSTREVPRFLSFLTVPLLMLLASGIAAVFTATPRRRSVALGALATTTLVLLGIGIGRFSDVVRLPREAHKQAAAVILAQGSAIPVFAQVVHPRDLDFYLDRPVVRPPLVTDARVCSSRGEVVFVHQPWAIRPSAISCSSDISTTSCWPVTGLTAQPENSGASNSSATKSVLDIIIFYDINADRSVHIGRIGDFQIRRMTNVHTEFSIAEIKKAGHHDLAPLEFPHLVEIFQVFIVDAHRQVFCQA